jgi:hypothetical protein
MGRVKSSLHQFVEAITGWLDQARIPYMLAGSFASTLHGRPRSTQDVDLVIDPTEAALRAFVASIPDDRAYVDLYAALEALRARDMFNVIDMETGWKADLILRKARPFSALEFERRRPIHWDGLTITVASPEDVVISKLEWCRRSGGSKTQIDDVAGVVAAAGADLDLAYIERWVDELGLAAEWAAANAG